MGNSYHIIIQIFVYLLAFTIIAAFITALIVFIKDKNQTETAILRNFPVLGHFRYFFEFLGKFLRQYFFAMDREEMPFNRAQRTWVYRSAKGLNNTVPFGSTKNTRAPGSVMFVNSLFPQLGNTGEAPLTVTYGRDIKHPFTTEKFFNISAMSFGSLSSPAVTALSQGAKKAGIWMNTGEGGLSPYHLSGGCDVIFQIGTAKFGVRDKDGNLCDKKLTEVAAKPQVKMFEIKLSQGAKPGKGGILPAAKVTQEIADIRGIPVGKDVISPNRFVEVNNFNDLIDMLNHVRAVTQKPTGVKFCVGDINEIEALLKAIKVRGAELAPDFITIDSGDGGTGAAPMSLIDSTGMTVNESLPLVIDLLVAHGLRERVKVIVSGKLINPRDVAWALAMGADSINSARGFMFSLGCIQALHCNSNTCPTGITTHNSYLQKGLVPEVKADRVANYEKNMVKEVTVIANSCGVAHPRQLRRNHIRIVREQGHSELISSE